MSKSTRPPIWVISLVRAVDRRAFIEAGYDRLGIPYEVIDGVDGAQLTNQQVRESSQTRALFYKGRRLTQGNLGCALSHLAAYRRMVDEDVGAAVIMEDDALPTLDLLQVLDEIDSLPDDWDVVTFCSQFDRATPVPVDGSGVGDYRLCTYGRVPFGGQCYLVRLRAARRLLEVGYPVCMPPDDLLFQPWPARLRVYGYEPKLATDGAFSSELVARGGEVGERSGAVSFDPFVVVAGKVVRRVRTVGARAIALWRSVSES